MGTVVAVKRWWVVLALLAGCGGGGEPFNEPAVRAELSALGYVDDTDAVDRLVELIRGTCTADRDVANFTVALHAEEGNTESLALIEAGCPDRYAEIRAMFD